MTTNTAAKQPFYTKVAYIFVALFLFVYTLWLAKNILVPIVYALILAILMNPIVNFLILKKIPKIVAISITLLLSFLFLSVLLYLLIAQSADFNALIPEIRNKFTLLSNQFLHWVSIHTNIHVTEVEKWVLETRNNQFNDFASTKNMTIIGQFAITIFLIPVYLFTILYYKPIFVAFIRRLFDTHHQFALEEVLKSTKKIVQGYLVGLFFELIIVAVLNTTGLFILGIEYAILLGVLGAILNLIPYLGGILGVLAFMAVALVTKSPIYMLYVAIMYSFIQFIDNNVIIPWVVAARVQINAFISIIVVIIGGAIWGIAGMFLSIPITAIIKVIFDHIDTLKPWGFLLGDIIPTKKKNLVKPVLSLFPKLMKNQGEN